MEENNDPSVGGSNVMLLSCKFNGDLHIFSVDMNTKLDDLMRDIKQRWDECDTNLVHVQYQAPEQGLYVTLCTDDDIRIMCQMHSFLKKRIVDCIVIPKDRLNQSSSEVASNTRYCQCEFILYQPTYY